MTADLFHLFVNTTFLQINHIPRNRHNLNLHSDHIPFAPLSHLHRSCLNPYPKCRQHRLHLQLITTHHLTTRHHLITDRRLIISRQLNTGLHRQGLPAPP